MSRGTLKIGAGVTAALFLAWMIFTMNDLRMSDAGQVTRAELAESNAQQSEVIGELRRERAADREDLAAAIKQIESLGGEPKVALPVGPGIRFVPVPGRRGKPGRDGPSPAEVLAMVQGAAAQALADFCADGRCTPEDGIDGKDAPVITSAECDGTTGVFHFNQDAPDIRVENMCAEPEPEPTTPPPGP